MQGSGKSSLAIWTAFDNATTALTRVLKFALNIAWTRIFDGTKGFALIDTAVIGGTDIIQGQNAVVTRPDAYEYFDETSRVMSIAYDRVLIEPFGGVSMALLDVVLDNHDSRFTPDQNATIGTAILPKRPINAHIGFDVRDTQITLPMFKGLTKAPEEIKNTGVVKIQSIDYVKYLYEYTLDSELYEDKRTDEIIKDILTTVGFGTSQYALDTALNTVGYAWFDKNDTAGQRIKKLCEGEGGVFFQDENGILRFESRRKFSQAPYNASQWNVEPQDIVLWENDRATPIINKVSVIAKPRKVKALQVVWTDGIEEQIGPGDTIEIWAQLDDPVTVMTAPVESTDYTAFTATGGGGADISSDISIVNTDFATAVKLEITNNNVNRAFLNLMQLRGTPAKVVDDILENFQDDDSINKYDEQLYEVENDFIQSRTFAQYLAKSMVEKHRVPAKRVKLTVQGIPQLQLRDMVTVTDQDLGTTQQYRVMRIQGKLELGGFTQVLTVREITDDETDNLAIIGIATIDNTEEGVSA